MAADSGPALEPSRRQTRLEGGCPEGRQARPLPRGKTSSAAEDHGCGGGAAIAGRCGLPRWFALSGGRLEGERLFAHVCLYCITISPRESGPGHDWDTFLSPTAAPVNGRATVL